jgi:oxygen-independent coproporphyrinogen-3 oxidase
MRIANILSPQAYIQRMIADAAPILCFPRTPAAAQATAIDRQAEIAETMMMGLRLTQEGISRRTFFARFSLRLEEHFGKEIGGLMRKGLLEWAGEGGEVLRLTPRGRLLGNQVFVEFV